ncbi:MAG: hypothetical protein KDA24_13450 [Deltaproteobacteria bacterium]|nr:hypothetical protein [Deltaproteobacteria bacterium]
MRALVVGELAERLDDLRDRTALQVRRQEEAASWQWHHLEKRDGMESCSPRLTVAAGFALPAFPGHGR